MTSRAKQLIQFSPLPVFLEDCSTAFARLEQLRRERGGELRDLLDQTPGLLDELIRSVVILEANPAAVKLFGYDDEAQLRAHLRQDPSPMLQEALLRELEVLWAQDDQSRFQVELNDPQGQALTLDIHWTQFEGEKPFDQVAVYISDVTEQNAKAQALRQSEQRLAKSQEIGQMGNWHWDIASGALSWSDQIYRIFGLEPQAFEATYEAFLERVHPDDRSVVTEGVQRAIDQMAPYRVDHRIILPNGEVRWVHEQGQVIYDETGQAIEFDGTVQDVTERHQFEEELIAARQQADQANQAKTNFLSTMSHELRTPMNGVLGLAELLYREERDPDRREMLRLVRQSGQALLEVLEEILDISRIEASKVKPLRLHFSPGDLIARMANLFAGAAKAKGLKLSHHLDLGICDNALGDPRLVEEVLSNLLGNAVKFTPTGEVRLEVSLLENLGETQKLRFQVSDTGIGIDQNQQKQIFEPFTQADNSSTRDFGGTGLGLAIALRLVRLMDGELEVESTLGQGSRFWFDLELPVAPSQFEARPAEPVAGNTPEAKILLVEDEEINRLVAGSLLEKYGYEVSYASNGKQAVELVRNRPFDLVLMDCLMPVMDGYAATRAIRKLPQGKQLLVVALTARAMQGDREFCLAVGMDDYLSKPVHSDELRNMIEHHLRSGRRPGPGSFRDLPN